jgi:hypothetical protein
MVGSWKKYFIIQLLVLLTMPCYFGQSTFTLKYFGLTVHPFGDPTAELQPYKLDRNAVLVANFGLFVGYEKFIYKDLISLKVLQAGFSDCSAGAAGFTHLGVRVVALDRGKHYGCIGFGPVFLYRNSWTRFGEEYESSGYFNETDTRWGRMQYKLIPYGLDLEYDYALNEQNSLSFSMTPGIPMAIIFAVGWKHWFHKKEETYKKVIYVPR